MTKKINPLKGEIWIINLDPTIGTEINKTRPAVIVNEQMLNYSKRRIIVPLTTWKPEHKKYSWLVPIPANLISNLNNDSTADASQVRSISTKRCIKKIGSVTSSQMDEILDAIAICVDL